ncbi:MAG: methyltransferase [Pseudomonadota bacterium]
MQNRSHEQRKTRPDTWLDRLKAARIRLIRNRNFQKFAADFWPTRHIAHSTAAASFDLCAGFIYSQILLACIETRLLDALSDAPLTIDDISRVTGLPTDGATRLIRAASDLKLAEARSRERFGLGPMGAAILSNPGVVDMIAHHRSLYDDLRNPVALLKARRADTELAKFWPYAAGEGTISEEDRLATKSYSDLMGRTQGFIAEDVLDAYNVKRHRHLMDVAGGNGTFLAAAKQRARQLDITLFDLPAVADLASDRFEASSIDANIVGGDMFKDAWPEGRDLISLVRILHDHDDDKVMQILGRARDALLPGGTLLIAEPTADSDRIGDAYFGIYLWAMGSGRPRRAEEICAMLQRAGFTSARQKPTRQPFLVRVITAT